MSSDSATERSVSSENGSSLVLVMVGLPARGKTYTARRLSRYLNWRGYRTRVFNVGNYRRREVGARAPATFFDPANESGRHARERVALDALRDLLTWLEEAGGVAIYDATNSTRARRAEVYSRVRVAGDSMRSAKSLILSMCAVSIRKKGEPE